MAKRARLKYVLSRWTVIVAASAIPFFVAFSESWARILTGILGVVIATVNGVEAVGKYHDKWLRWRGTAQQLILVRNSYSHKSETGFKNDAKRDENLIKRLNEILDLEFESWKNTHHGEENSDSGQPTSN